jgi:hypothetical protein
VIGPAVERVTLEGLNLKRAASTIGTSPMVIDADTAHAPQILVLRARDEWPIFNDSQALQPSLIASGHLTPATRSLIDVRDVMTPRHTGEEGVALASAMAGGGLPLVRAYLIGSEVQFKLAQQLQTLAPSDTRIQVFSNEQAAFMWLHES